MVARIRTMNTSPTGKQSGQMHGARRKSALRLFSGYCRCHPMIQHMSDRILLIEADPEAREAQRALLQDEGYDTATAADAREAVQQIESSAPDVIVCDLAMPGTGGADLLLQLTRSARQAAIVVTSSKSEEQAASDAMARGAYAHLVQPISATSLLSTLRNACERARLRRDNQLLRWQLSRSIGEQSIVAASAPMITLLETLEKVAQQDSSVLLRGECGTGKEVLARAIHSLSKRRNRNFLSANCTLRPDDRIEAELFGPASASTRTERTGHGLIRHADRGILYLDEVSELPLALQSRLLAFLQHEPSEQKAGQPDVRVLAATTKDLELEVSEGRFQPDLYRILSTLRLEVPPLRERRKDIPLLVDHFISRYRQLLVKPVRRMTDDAIERLVAHNWKGNVRELENVVERAVILAKGDYITAAELPMPIANGQESEGESDDNLCLKRARRKLEVELIRRALRATGGNRTHAARRLEISHRALLYKIKEYRIRD